MRMEVMRHCPFGCALLSVLLSPSVSATPSLSPQIPFDVTVAEEHPTLASLQRDFDDLSWQTFIALNWPALDNGHPNTGTPIGKQDGATVWESWKESYQIFRANGQAPLAWDAPATLPAACTSLKPGRLFQRAEGGRRGKGSDGRWR